MAIDIKKKLKKESSRSYLSKDFNSFRAELLQYARTYFSTHIQDFSEGGVGGLFLDMSAFVGDSLCFYLDHQFNELNPLTAVEPANIVQHLINAGVPIAGASPAVVSITFHIEVTFEMTSTGERRPGRSMLPVIGAGTILLGDNGIAFNLVEDVDFSKTNAEDELLAAVSIFAVNSTGLPTKYTLSLAGTCISGKEKEITFTVPNAHTPFRRYTLSDPDVSDVISVKDSNGNTYYEVEALTQDVVFGGTPTIDSDGDVVEQNMEIIPAPYRFLKRTNPQTNITTLTFGGGNAETYDNDIVPDPSDLALPLYGKKTFSRFTIDPGSLLGTQTLGIAPQNTTLTIKYRFGGGLLHNTGAQTINVIQSLRITFLFGANAVQAQAVRASIRIANISPAVGGLPAPSLEDFRAAIPASRQMQSRIVSKADTIARIYTLPNKFGRVFRAAISGNPNNPLASNLHIISRDSSGFLTLSSDVLKKNLSKYLNQFRLVSDAVDILDAQVLNFAVRFSIVSHPSANKEFVVQSVINRLRPVLSIENFQINQPIVLADLLNVIINTDGVISVIDMPEIHGMHGVIEGREYDHIAFTPKNMEVRGMIVPPAGSIFQLKYPDFDIVGNSGLGVIIMYLILSASKDTYITDKIIDNAYSASNANVGRASTLDLFKLYNESYLSGVNPTNELSRILIQFDLSRLTDLMKTSLDVNSPSFKCKLKLYDVMAGQTTPANFKLILFPLSQSSRPYKSWNEGIGKNVVSFSDLDAANFLTSSYNLRGEPPVIPWDWAWNASGANAQGNINATALSAGWPDNIDVIISGNLNDGDGSKALGVMQTFPIGNENLEMDVTTIVSATLAGILPASGFRVSFTGSEENDTKTRFVKRFASRHVSDVSLRPRLDVSYNDTIIDNHRDFYFDLSGSIFLKNFHRGIPANIHSGSALKQVSGTNCLIVTLKSGSFSKTISGSSHQVGTKVVLQDGSAANFMSGVYSASFAIPSNDTTFVDFNTTLQQMIARTGSVTFDEYWSSPDRLTGYYTGSMTIERIPRTSFNVSPRRLDFIVTNAKNSYSKSEKVLFRVFVRDFNEVFKKSRIPYDIPSVVLKEVYYRVRDADSDTIYIPFETTNDGTRLSSDSGGMFFELFMDLPPGRTFTFEFLSKESGLEFITEAKNVRFRIE